MRLLIHEDRLRGVHPQLVLVAKAWANQLTWDILIIEGVRTNARQAQLYAQGRTTPGPIVTMAANTLDSAHGRRWVNGQAYGMAMDAAPCTGVGGEPDWNDKAAFEEMATIAERMGCIWGGRWTKFPDGDHFQMAGWRDYPPAPDDAPPPTGSRPVPPPTPPPTDPGTA